MAKRTFQIVAIVAAIALVGLASFTVLAAGGGSGEQGGGFLRHLHEMVGQHLHHGGHHQDHMAEVIEQLELTPDQVRRLEAIHEVVGAFGSEGHGSMAELHDQLVESFDQGYIDPDEVRQMIDQHLEEMRRMAYGAADELVALVNSLDATQRETLSAHLHGNQERHTGHGHSH